MMIKNPIQKKNRFSISSQIQTLKNVELDVNSALDAARLDKQLRISKTRTSLMKKKITLSTFTLTTITMTSQIFKASR